MKHSYPLSFSARIARLVSFFTIFLIFCLFFQAAIFPVIAYAQESSILVLINNGDEKTTSNIVEVQLSCYSPAPNGCDFISVQWANTDANDDPDSVDVIVVTVSSDRGSSDEFYALETGANTAVFTFTMDNINDFSGFGIDVPLVSSLPPLPTPEEITWQRGERVTIHNLPFSSDEGIKSVTAFFYPGGSASDDILLTPSAPNGDCSLQSSDTLSMNFSDTLLKSTRGIPASTTISLAAPSSNHDRVATRIFVQSPEGSPQFSLSQNDFFINPGENRNVLLSFNLPVTVPYGNYTYLVTTTAEDVSGCEIKENSAEVMLGVFPEPDLFFSSSSSELILVRGNNSSMDIGVETLAHGLGPMHIEFQAGWTHESTDIPAYTQIDFDSRPIDLDPGNSVTREVSFYPSISEDLTAPNYLGHFTYTFQANGSWTDASGSTHVISKSLILPVSIIEEEFDFAITADRDALLLEEGKTATIALSITHVSGRNYPVTLTPVVAAIGLDVDLEQTEGIPDFSTTLRVTPRATITPRELEVIAEGREKTHSAKVLLSNAPFTMTMRPESIISPAQNSTVAISVDKIIQKYNSTVHLQLLSEIPQVTLRLNEDEAFPTYSTELVISTGSTTPLGDYPIEIVASDGIFSTSFLHVLHVVMPSVVVPPVVVPSVVIDVEPRLNALSIDGSLLPSSKLEISPDWKLGERHELTALSEVMVNGTTKYVFDGWSDGIGSLERVVDVSTSGLTIVGKYRPQYLLTIESERASTIGAGWYDAFSVADVGIAEDSTSFFNGWSGPSANAVNIACDGQKIKDDGNSFKICMDKPQTLIALWKEDSPSAGIIAGTIASLAIGVFIAITHFVIPKPVSKPTIPVEKGHTFGFRVEVHLDEIDGIVGVSGDSSPMLDAIPNLSLDSLSQTANNVFNMLILQDTGETYEQFKQLKFIRNWIKKGHARGGSSEGVSGAGSPESAGLDAASELKKILVENLGKASTPDLVRMIRGALVSQLHSQLEKGIESVPIPLPVIGISIEFVPLVDGVPVKNNILRVPFQIAAAVELKGAKSVLHGSTKSFFANFVDLRLKLYYMMPMMIGLKKVRMAENLTHIAKDVSFQQNDE